MSAAPALRPAPPAALATTSPDAVAVRARIAAGVLALSLADRERLRAVGRAVRLLQRQSRWVNNVPAAVLFIWPVAIWWLLPWALRARLVASSPTLRPLVEASRALPRENWGVPPDDDAVGDVVALRDQGRLFAGAILLPAIVFGALAAGLAIVAR